MADKVTEFLVRQDVRDQAEQALFAADAAWSSEKLRIDPWLYRVDDVGAEVLEALPGAVRREASRG